MVYILSQYWIEHIELWNFCCRHDFLQKTFLMGCYMGSFDSRNIRDWDCRHYSTITISFRWEQIIGTNVKVIKRRKELNWNQIRNKELICKWNQRIIYWKSSIELLKISDTQAGAETSEIIYIMLVNAKVKKYFYRKSKHTLLEIV